MTPQQVAPSALDLGLIAVVIAALLAAGAAIWVARRTQAVAGQVLAELSESQERLAREQRQHQAELAREQRQHQAEQAREQRQHQAELAREQQASQAQEAEREREHRLAVAEQARAHQERLARTAHASQVALDRYRAARARRERRIDALLEHVTRQTTNATRILPAFENGRHSDAWRLLEAIMRERDAFERMPSGMVNDPAVLQAVLAYGQAESELRDALARRIDALEEGVPTPVGEEVAAAYVHLTRRASEVETAVERYIAGG